MLISIGLFVVACLTPALVLHNRFYTNGSHWVGEGYKTIVGGELLVQGLTMGWIRLNFTAFANLPLWLGWILFGRGIYDGARNCAAAALVISIETLQLTVQPYLYDEGGSTKGCLAAPHIGFLCWVGSMAVLFFASRRKILKA